ncbi:MAG: (Fe-S)-binding protein [Propionibacteriaceae bacterium]|jgi:L-lactate dehydrogenase complex protein LldE|nr:(Fe-S)-binding protein [Propionibacteriaceae bacterium]
MEQPGHGLTVGLFATCVNDIMFPGTVRATMGVLTRLGCRVEFPDEQTCCGQMFTNTGYFSAGLATVRAFVQAFAKYDYVVAPSASCIGSVRHQHEMLSQNKPALARQVKTLVARSYDLCEFLVDVLGVTDVGASFPHTVTYHLTCHARRVACVGDRPRRLLEAVRGLTLVDLPEAETCCGFGGTFSVKNSAVSVALATDKARNIVATGAEFVVAGDNACLMNVGGVLRREGAAVKPIHLAHILNSEEAVR